MTPLLGCLLLTMAMAWDHGLGPVSHVTLVGHRAILSILREDHRQPYTLVEARWPEMPKPFPSYFRPFPLRDPQTAGDCMLPQSVVCSGWDGLTNIFVLDSGWDFCSPKLLIYDIISNKKITEIELSGVTRTRLNSLVVDSSSVYGPRVYIGESRPGYLIVFDTRSLHWLEVPMSVTQGPVSQPPSAFLLSLASGFLYLASDKTDILFGMDLTTIRTSRIEEINASGSVVVVGLLLGLPSAMEADHRRGLYYCLPQDCVCVRWDSRRPLVAESHQVLLQSAELLSQVHQIFLDHRRQPWALALGVHHNHSHCVPLAKPPLGYPWLYI